MEKRGAREDIDGKILTKGKLSADKIRAKKELVSGPAPISKTVSIAKKLSTGPGSRQGTRQEDRRERREQYKQVQRQEGGNGTRRRPDKAANQDREGQRVVSKPSYWTGTQQMKAELNNSQIENSGTQEKKRSSVRRRPTWQGPKAARNSLRARGKEA